MIPIISQIFLILLGSTALSALVNQIGNSIQFKQQRKASKEDKCSENDDRIAKLEAGFKEISKKQDELFLQQIKLMEASKASLRDRIKYLCGVYIKQGCIDEDDLDNLDSMHVSYRGVGGNGHLDKLMERVHELPIVSHGD